MIGSYKNIDSMSMYMHFTLDYDRLATPNSCQYKITKMVIAHNCCTTFVWKLQEVATTLGILYTGGREYKCVQNVPPPHTHTQTKKNPDIHLNSFSHLVIDPQTYELCQECPREVRLDELGIPHGTLIETLSHYFTGKQEVLQLPSGRARTGVVRMDLQE